MESRKGKTETTLGTCTETHAVGVRNFFASCPGILSVILWFTVIKSDRFMGHYLTFHWKCFA